MDIQFIINSKRVNEMMEAELSSEEMVDAENYSNELNGMFQG